MHPTVSKHYEEELASLSLGGIGQFEIKFFSKKATLCRSLASKSFAYYYAYFLIATTQDIISLSVEHKVLNIKFVSREILKMIFL